MKAGSSSGRLVVLDEVMNYQPFTGEGWQVALEKIRVIGEYTTTDGPFGDDCFFVFLTCDAWYEASFYAEGRDSVLMELKRRLQHPVHCELTFSTDVASRVMWPPHLEGQPLFDFIAKPAGSNVLSRLWQRLFPTVDLHFTDAVRAACR